LELAVETTPPDETGTVRVTLAVAEESIQQRAVLYRDLNKFQAQTKPKLAL
jgi:hypothetical protein